MIELEGVGFGYVPGQWIFRHLSLRLVPGEVTAVLRPNGQGKTTLLRCAAGLLKPREGTVRRGAAIGFVPQAHQTAFAYTVLDMVLMGRARHIGPFASPRARDFAVAQGALARVGLVNLEERPFPQLSGGQQQLVLIARALASESEILILDEPASALDLRNQGQILRLLRQLAADGLTVLLTTHHPHHAQFVADRVILMHGPEQCQIGPTAEILAEANLEKLYGIRMRKVSYEDNGRMRETLTPIYD